MAEIPVESPVEVVPARKAVVRVRPSFGRRIGQSFRNWARDSFGREQFIASLKTLGWVAPMTVLIWVYAEREQTSKQPVQFHIEARNNDPTRLVILRGPGLDGQMSTNFTVRADLAGPNARLDDAKKKLEAGGGLQIDIPENLEQGAHQIPLSSLLANNPAFEKAGLTPSSLIPSQIDVVIDAIVTLDAPLIIRPTVKNLDGPPRFQQSTIKVTGPQSVLTAARNDGRLVAYADLPNLTEPGPKSIPNVPVTVPINDPHVHLSPSTVAADYTVKSPFVEDTLRGVTVLAAYPHGDPWEKFKPQYDATLSEVKVIGSPEVIADVKRADFADPPRVYLDLSKIKPSPGNNPVPGKQYEAPLHYEFGATGLTASPDAQASLQFTIVPRTGGPE